MITTKKAIGADGEKMVAEHLKQAGFAIIALNYTKPYGEIDIIACKKDLLACIEVKTRHNALVDPATLVPPSKQRKIIMVAKDFIAQHYAFHEMTCRFDVALVEKKSNSYTISYIENAFFENE
jgi:putative endonuclease